MGVVIFSFTNEETKTQNNQAAVKYTSMSGTVFKYQDSDSKLCAVYPLVWNSAHPIV